MFYENQNQNQKQQQISELKKLLKQQKKQNTDSAHKRMKAGDLTDDDIRLIQNKSAEDYKTYRNKKEKLADDKEINELMYEYNNQLNLSELIANYRRPMPRKEYEPIPNTNTDNNSNGELSKVKAELEEAKSKLEEAETKSKLDSEVKTELLKAIEEVEILKTHLEYVQNQAERELEKTKTELKKTKTELEYNAQHQSNMQANQTLSDALKEAELEYNAQTREINLIKAQAQAQATEARATEAEAQAKLEKAKEEAIAQAEAQEKLKQQLKIVQNKLEEAQAKLQKELQQAETKFGMLTEKLRAEKAEAKVREAIAKIKLEEANKALTEEAEARAREAKARVQEAEARVQEAEARVQEAEAQPMTSITSQAQKAEAQQQLDTAVAKYTILDKQLKTTQNEMITKLKESEARVQEAEAQAKLEKAKEEAIAQAEAQEKLKQQLKIVQNKLEEAQAEKAAQEAELEEAQAEKAAQEALTKNAVYKARVALTQANEAQAAVRNAIAVSTKTEEARTNARDKFETILLDSNALVDETEKALTKARQTQEVIIKSQEVITQQTQKLGEASMTYQTNAQIYKEAKEALTDAQINYLDLKIASIESILKYLQQAEAENTTSVEFKTTLQKEKDEYETNLYKFSNYKVDTIAAAEVEARALEAEAKQARAQETQALTALFFIQTELKARALVNETKNAQTEAEAKTESASGLTPPEQQKKMGIKQINLKKAIERSEEVTAPVQVQDPAPAPAPAEDRVREAEEAQQIIARNTKASDFGQNLSKNAQTEAEAKTESASGLTPPEQPETEKARDIDISIPSTNRRKLPALDTKNKYQKYKQKYLHLKKLIEGHK
jgi:hypothetical protein